jgi:hypothetical protein
MIDPFCLREAEAVYEKLYGKPETTEYLSSHYEKMEDEPAYRLGVACSLIEALLGIDKISQEFASSRKFVKKNARKWALKFLAKEKKRSEEIHNAVS